ncbi:hypothetical protein [Bradyrhizobium sp. LA7.1]|uniref:hypothetical protein n=1 Tax=Bradyrhizobium sp. LA7.1 TaxID=3156324 RepID=UPI00339A50A3
MTQHFCEKNQIAQGFLPVAMNTAANNGDWVSMKGYGRMAIVLFKAVGTPGDDPTVTVKQAQNVSGAGAKAIAFTEVRKKQAATNLLAVDQFTKSTTAAPATNDTFNTTNGTWTNTDLAEQAAIIVIDVRLDDLDINGGFTSIQASIADVGTNSQLGCALYFGHEPHCPIDVLDSMIVD